MAYCCDVAADGGECLCAIPKIDWDDENTAELKAFLKGHVAAMAHCDEHTDSFGLCECVHRLAEWWAGERLKRQAVRASKIAYRDRMLEHGREIDRLTAELKAIAFCAAEGWQPFDVEKVYGIAMAALERLAEPPSETKS